MSCACTLAPIKSVEVFIFMILFKMHRSYDEVYLISVVPGDSSDKLSGLERGRHIWM